MIVNDNNPEPKKLSSYHIQDILDDWPSALNVGAIPSRRAKLREAMEKEHVSWEVLEGIYDRHFMLGVPDGNFLATFAPLADALGGDTESAHFFFYANHLRQGMNEAIDGLVEVKDDDLKRRALTYDIADYLDAHLCTIAEVDSSQAQPWKFASIQLVQDMIKRMEPVLRHPG